jgi:uncharacterized protein YbjT (DUF2867 family)
MTCCTALWGRSRRVPPEPSARRSVPVVDQPLEPGLVPDHQPSFNVVKVRH